MKKIILLGGFILVACHQKTLEIEKNKQELVELSCGKCNFGEESKKCELAIRKDGKTAYVSNHSFDEFGDPHAPNGLCRIIKKAKVKGEMTDKGFVANEIIIVK